MYIYSSIKGIKEKVPKFIGSIGPLSVMSTLIKVKNYSAL